MSEVTKFKAKARRYVLTTAAYNEEEFIRRTLESVVAQTLLPERWVIVSDGSTDKTDEIVEHYAKKYSFIRLLRLTRAPGRNFGAKVRALHQATKLLDDVEFDFIGNVDADVAFDPCYFETIINHFEQEPELGIEAGFIHEEEAGEFRSRRSNRVDSVPHAAQLVRKECYRAIGGYAILKYGGEDWYAQTCARMNGWQARAVPALRVLHFRHTGSATNLLRDRFRLGRLDHSLGSDPLFEVFKCAARISERPRIGGAMARLAGFCWSSLTSEKRTVSTEFVNFLRGEQRGKISRIMSSSERHFSIG